MTREEVIKFLHENPLMAVAINAHPWPISSILLFALDDDMNVYFATHASTYKSKALALTSEISFSVWKQDAMLVQASGVAEHVKDEESVNKVLDMLTDSVERVEEFWPPILQFEPDSYAVYKISVKWLRSLDLSNKNISADNNFVEIIK